MPNTLYDINTTSGNNQSIVEVWNVICIQIYYVYQRSKIILYNILQFTTNLLLVIFLVLCVVESYSLIFETKFF